MTHNKVQQRSLIKGGEDITLLLRPVNYENQTSLTL